MVASALVLMMCTFTVVTPCDPRDSCFGNHDFFCNKRKEGIYDGEEEGEQRVEEEIKKNHEETKGFRSGKRSGVQTRVVQRTKDEAADNVVIIATGSGAKFSAFQPVRHFNLKNGETSSATTILPPLSTGLNDDSTSVNVRAEAGESDCCRVRTRAPSK